MIQLPLTTQAISKEELTRVKAYYTQKYGMEVDSFMACIMLEIEAIKKESLKQSKEFRAFHPRNIYDSFAFGFAKSGFIGIALCIASYAYYIKESTIQDSIEERTRKLFLKNHPEAIEFYPLINNGKTIKRNGGTYLRLSKTKEGEKIIPGKNYLYDKDCNCVYIPINFNL